MKIFAIGSSLVSSYWNGAATYYRGIYTYLARMGHEITFAEPRAFDRQEHRDDGDFSYAHSVVYDPGVGLDALLAQASNADVVVKHSGVGVDDAELERRVLECRPAKIVFCDVDTPATVSRMNGDVADPFPASLRRYSGVISYCGGAEAEADYRRHGAQNYFVVPNGLDPETHFPVSADPALACDLVFLGNRLPDREARVEELFLRAAALAPEFRFLLGGEGWGDKPLPANVRWLGHVPTALHNRVNSSARMVLNINRASMATYGYSPPTRIFEVAGAGAALLCDAWPGVEAFFAPEGEELEVVCSAEDVVAALRRHDAASARAMGQRLLARALRDHTYAERAMRIDRAMRHGFSDRAADAADDVRSSAVISGLQPRPAFAGNQTRTGPAMAPAGWR